MTETFLIVGLGNPGRDYRETRHNIGFMSLDHLALTLGCRFSRLQSKALVANVLYHENRIILAKPQTFMNMSGQSVQGLVRFYKLQLSNIMIIHDDLDLALGTIRIRPDGGSAGQKGMESIIDRLGTDKFARIRLGIGRPPGQMQAPDYVLQEFSSSEHQVMTEMLSRAADAVQAWLTKGLDAAMTQYNGAFG